MARKSKQQDVNETELISTETVVASVSGDTVSVKEVSHDDEDVPKVIVSKNESVTDSEKEIAKELDYSGDKPSESATMDESEEKKPFDEKAILDSLEALVVEEKANVKKQSVQRKRQNVNTSMWWNGWCFE